MLWVYFLVDRGAAILVGFDERPLLLFLLKLHFFSSIPLCFRYRDDMRSLWLRQDDFGGVVQSGVQRFTGSGPYSSAFSGSGGVGLPRYSVSLGVESTL